MAATVAARKWVVRAYGPSSTLELMDFTTPSLGPDDVLIKVLATTSTYTDQLIIRGNYRPCPPLPCTPGYDLIGLVLGVGARVSGLAPGDRVASMPQAGC